MRERRERELATVESVAATTTTRSAGEGGGLRGENLIESRQTYCNRANTVLHRETQPRKPPSSFARCCSCNFASLFLFATNFYRLSNVRDRNAACSSQMHDNERHLHVLVARIRCHNLQDQVFLPRWNGFLPNFRVELTNFLLQPRCHLYECEGLSASLAPQVQTDSPSLSTGRPPTACSCRS